MIPIRVYADTSVFGGVFDPEFETPSRIFFDQVRSGRFRLVTSTVLADEIGRAPEPVQTLFHEMAPGAELFELSEPALRLQRAYLEAHVVGVGSRVDALHVALATVFGCRVIVSWNFKHIVHFQKIPLYNAVSVVHGYMGIAIHSPSEVISYGEQEL